MPKSLDSFKCRSVLTVDGKDYVYFSLPKAEANGLKGVSKLPYSMKVLLENLLRFEDGQSVTKEHILAVSEWLNNKGLTETEIALLPDLIATRLLITVAITGWRAQQHPENRQYILRNNGLAWTGLARLDALPRQQASDILLAASQTPMETLV